MKDGARECLMCKYLYNTPKTSRGIAKYVGHLLLSMLLFSVTAVLQTAIWRRVLAGACVVLKKCNHGQQRSKSLNLATYRTKIRVAYYPPTFKNPLFQLCTKTPLLTTAAV